MEVIVAWIEKTGKDSSRVRYRRDDDTTGSVPGFPTKKAAADYAADLESDQRRGTWLDPCGFRTTLAEWVGRWFPTLDLDRRTLENYDSYLRCHILPQFGTTALGSITTLDIKLWAKEAAEAGYAPATISGWVNLLSMILTDAVDQRLIPANPIHKRRRRGRRSRRITPEKVWATPEQVLRIADQAGMLGGPIARLLIITAAWTGCRWGELTGLHRRNVDLRRGLITIDPYEGSLHESHGER
jgi:integrase